jgi:hypothetical protein
MATTTIVLDGSANVWIKPGRPIGGGRWCALGNLTAAMRLFNRYRPLIARC